MNGNECPGTCLFKGIVSESQVNSRYMISLLIQKLTTGMTDLMLSLGNNITNFNKNICSVGTDICAHEEDPCNILLQIFTTNAECSLENFTYTFS